MGVKCEVWLCSTCGTTFRVNLESDAAQQRVREHTSLMASEAVLLIPAGSGNKFLYFCIPLRREVNIVCVLVCVCACISEDGAVHHFTALRIGEKAQQGGGCQLLKLGSWYWAAPFIHCEQGGQVKHCHD